MPTAVMRCFDGGHLVLDEYADAIAETITRNGTPLHGAHCEAGGSTAVIGHMLPIALN